MEFIKTLKKREYIEMTLKTLTALIFAFIAVILMEGMIYSIYLNAYKTNGTKSISVVKDSVLYCIEDGENSKGETLYFVLIRNENKGEVLWQADAKTKYTADAIPKSFYQTNNFVWHAPNAFEFTISPVHYVVISIFILGVGGFFTYKFFKLAKSYKEIEETYKKTGTIEIG